MTFLLPNLSGTSLRFLTVCAECVDSELAERFSGEDCELEVNYGSADRIYLIVGRLGRKKTAVHVHVDLAQESSVAPRRRKKTKPAANTEQQVHEVLTSFLGKSVSVCIHARFSVRLDEISSAGYIAKQLGQSTCVNGINALLMGQTIAIENMDLQWFAWSAEEGGILVTVHGECDTEVSEEYLQEMRKVAEKWMHTVTDEDSRNG